MTISAEFEVNGDADVQVHETTYSTTVNLELVSLTGVRIIQWSIAGTSHASMVAPTITPAGSPTGATASFAMPAAPTDGEGRTVVVQCSVTGHDSTVHTSYRVVSVPNARGLSPIAVDEQNYRDATHGWVAPINTLLATAGFSAEVASDTSATSAGGTVAYSYPLPITGYKHLVKFIIEAKEQTDAINYTHVAYVLAWNSGGTCQIIGSPSVIMDRSHDASGVSATVDFSVAFTESGFNIVATLTNNSNHTADVNFYSSLEAAWNASP